MNALGRMLAALRSAIAFVRSLLALMESRRENIGEDDRYARDRR